MKTIPQKQIHKFLRHNKKFPHVWCPGCSDGIVLGAIIRAISELEYEKDNVAMISGIGCSSRMPVYADFNTAHTLHGRAIAYATGVKTFKPNMKVCVITGDGDAAAIGGNHLIHAARRNIDMTVVILNNNIYGMTGGQYSPTTPIGAFASTMQYGNIDNVFDLCELTMGAGATFVARTTASNPIEMQNFVKKAFEHKGFSVVEIICACPVIYGRLNKKGDAIAMMKAFQQNAVSLAKWEKMTEEEKVGKFPKGIFRDIERPEFCEQYAKLVESLKPKEKVEEAKGEE